MRVAEKNVRIAKSEELGFQRKRELASRTTQMNQIRVKLCEKDQMILELKKRLQLRKGGRDVPGESESLREQIKLLEEKLMSLRAVAMRHQVSEIQMRSEIEAQLRLIKSKDEMIKAR